MISQKQNNIRWAEEEIAPHIDQKPPYTPTFSWRGWSPWFIVLAVVVPLAAGFTRDFLETPNQESWMAYLLLTIVVGVVSAGLLRSWWAMLIVPGVYSVGVSLGVSFKYGFDVVVPSLLSYLMLFFIVLVEIGVLIGIPIGKKIGQRLQQ